MSVPLNSELQDARAEPDTELAEDGSHEGAELAEAAGSDQSGSHDHGSGGGVMSVTLNSELQDGQAKPKQKKEADGSDDDVKLDEVASDDQSSSDELGSNGGVMSVPLNSELQDARAEPDTELAEDGSNEGAELAEAAGDDQSGSDDHGSGGGVMSVTLNSELQDG